MAGKASEKKVREAIFGTEVKEHIIHPDRRIAVESIEKPEDVPQNR